MRRPKIFHFRNMQIVKSPSIYALNVSRFPISDIQNAAENALCGRNDIAVLRAQIRLANLVVVLKDKDRSKRSLLA